MLAFVNSVAIMASLEFAEESAALVVVRFDSNAATLANNVVLMDDTRDFSCCSS